MEDVKKWIEDNPKSSGYNYGCGSGYGSGSCDGSGYGFGSGNGSGWGDGSGYGNDYGSGDGYDDGSGYGSGDGSGYGNDYGWGDGYGLGSGSGISYFNEKKVYMIDGVSTIITNIKKSCAKGYILNTDFTLEPCYIVKGNGYYAHGKNLKEAQTALMQKIYSDMDPEEAIEEFMSKFEKGKSYKGTEFFEWHHYLTGSCLMGRETFVKNKGIDLEAEYTVDDFIAICENDYGSEVIKQLKEKWIK